MAVPMRACCAAKSMKAIGKGLSLGERLETTIVSLPRGEPGASIPKDRYREDRYRAGKCEIDRSAGWAELNFVGWRT